jgi:quinol-cytochrome oxidoreductase complex cytochrome b subunit
MPSTEKDKSNVLPAHKTGLWNWLNRRTGIDDLLGAALDEPIPGGARFAYIFGSGLLFIFLSQIITGFSRALLCSVRRPRP